MPDINWDRMGEWKGGSSIGDPPMAWAFMRGRAAPALSGVEALAKKNSVPVEYVLFPDEAMAS